MMTEIISMLKKLNHEQLLYVKSLIRELYFEG